MKKMLMFAAALLAVAAGFWFLNGPGGFGGKGEVVSDRAVVEGRLVPAGPAMAGVVAEVHVAAGDTVVRGQPLFTLDAAKYEADLARERAALAEIAASLPGGILVPSPMDGQAAPPDKPLDALKAEEEEARKALETAAHVHAAASVALSRMVNARGEYARPDPRRQAALIHRDEAAIMLRDAREAFDKASYARAKKESEEAAAAAKRPISAALAARIAEYRSQLSSVALAERNLAATVITAPEGGTVAIVAAARGMALTAGDTPVVIVPENSPGVWVTAFFPERDGGKLARGQQCVITVGSSGPNSGPNSVPDAGKIFTGRVGAVLPPSGAEKDVAARVILDKNEVPAPLAVGQPVSVTVFTRGKPDPSGPAPKAATEK